MPARQFPSSMHPRQPLWAGVLIAGAIVAPASVASAEPSQRSGSAVAVHAQAVSRSEQQVVLRYWTPERISSLTQPSSDNPPMAGPDGAPYTEQNALPRTVGRLFFTDHGEDASCTATVVSSANHSTVVTAAHCVNNTNLIGEDNQWATNVLFVPGYRDGQALYGKFVGRLAVVNATWLKNDQQDSEMFGGYDQAFVVLNLNERGRSVQDTVGAAQRIAFDVPGNQAVSQFGYPRASSDPARDGLPEYTGERLAYCTGQAKRVIGTPEYPSAEGMWGTECVMGGGSSGGPRITDIDPKSGLGTVVGDNTEGSQLDSTGTSCDPWDPAPGCTRHLVGPQFTSAITKPLYDRAQRSTQ